MVNIQQPCTGQMGRWSIFNNHVQYRREYGQYSTTVYRAGYDRVDGQVVKRGIMIIIQCKQVTREVID